MTVSVIIPTFNGAHKLPAILNAIEIQNCKPDEVIVVVDGSTDETYHVLKKRQEVMSSLKVYFQDNMGRASIRNKGAKEANGDLLIFFDDDMLPKQDCVLSHIQHHLKHANCILTGAQIDIGDDSRSDIQKFKSHLSYTWSKPLKESGDKPLNKGNIFITAANFSVCRDIFWELGGFDETLKDAEDFDLAVRAYRAGKSLFYKFSAFAWHNDLISCVSYIKRQRQYVKAHEFLIATKPWLVEEQFIRPYQSPSGFRKLIFRFFCSHFWINSVDKGRLKILPKMLRYKIYDLITTANGVYFPEKVKLS